jgi:ribosome-associated protein
VQEQKRNKGCKKGNHEKRQICPKRMLPQLRNRDVQNIGEQIDGELRDISSRKKIEVIAKAALAKKAEDVTLIDLRKLPSICDYFIIASGNSTTQIGAIADNIEKELVKHNCKIWHREGKAEALWILLDYGDIVAHVFYKETRGFYNLEKLWYDAPLKILKESSFRKKPRKKPKHPKK